MPQKFTLESIKRNLTKYLTPENIGTALGAAIGLAIPGEFGETPALGALGRMAGKSIGRLIGGATGGRILTKGSESGGQTPGGEQSAVGYRPFAEFSRITTPTPTPLPKAEITTVKPAPTPTPTPPPPPPVAGGAGAPTPPATAPGFIAPTLSPLPPAPVQISERAFTGIPAPRPAIPVGQFEAMIRALQELAGGRYIPRPLTGAEPFGPTGALERALRRLRERELGIQTT